MGVLGPIGSCIWKMYFDASISLDVCMSSKCKCSLDESIWWILLNEDLIYIMYLWVYVCMSLFILLVVGIIGFRKMVEWSIYELKDNTKATSNNQEKEKSKTHIYNDSPYHT